MARQPSASLARHHPATTTGYPPAPGAHAYARPHLLFLRALPGDERHPGKTVALRSDGTLDKPQPARIKELAPLPVPAPATVEALADVLRAASRGDYGRGYFVLGGLSHPGAATTSRRKTPAKAPDDPEAYIVDMPQAVACADLDHLPNSAGWTAERSDDAAAELAALVRRALGDESVGVVVEWSSSAFLAAPDGRPLAPGAAPADLSAHVWLLWARPVSEAERRRAGLALDAAVRTTWTGAAAERKHLVDQAPLIANQPLYVLAPRLIGLDDPLPGRRHVLFPGGPADPDALLAAAPAPAQAAPAKAKKRPDGTIARAAARAAATPAPALSRGDIDLMDRELAAIEAGIARLGGSGWTDDEWEAKGYYLHQARRVRDVVRLAEGRRADGVPGWESGVPVGQRNDLLVLIGSDLSHVCPSWDHARDLLRRVGWRLVGAYVDEWLSIDDRACGLATRAAEAAEGRTRTLTDGAGRERRVDPRMTYGRERVVADLLVSDEEAIRYGLTALRSEAVRSHQRRRAAGVPTLEERRAREAAASAASLRPWEAEGVSRATWYRLRATRETPRDRLLDPLLLRTAAAGETGIRRKGATAGEGVSPEAASALAPTQRMTPTPPPGADAGSTPLALDTAGPPGPAPVDPIPVPGATAHRPACGQHPQAGHVGEAGEASACGRADPASPGTAQEQHQALGGRTEQALMSEPEEVGMGQSREAAAPHIQTAVVVPLPGFLTRRASPAAPAKPARAAAGTCLNPGPLFGRRAT